MFKMANKLSVMTNALRSAVSKQRIRYKENGFNLDLAYICDNIIAMGVPADKIESIYRNRLEDVYKFLEENHHEHYKIYNLCLERRYDTSKFHGRVAVYPFEDHNPPTIELIQNFCKDVDCWLKSDRQNVAAVHCKAGKGRTGTMICCYLVYSGQQTTADEALAYYDVKRTTNGKGVTIPSQRRYVQYFAQLIRSGLQYVRRRMQLCEIRFSEPNMLQNQKYAQCVISVLKEAEGSLTVEPLKTLTVDFRKGDTLDLKNLSLPVAGDIKIEYKTPQKKIFHFWFNTYFVTEAAEIESEGNNNFLVYTLNKCEIDDAHKDTEHKCFAESFKVKLVFNTGQSEDTYLSQTNVMNDNAILQTQQQNDIYKSDNRNKVQNNSSAGDYNYFYSHNPSSPNFVDDTNNCDSSRINNKKISYDVVDRRLSFMDDDENHLNINNHLKDYSDVPSSRIIVSPKTPNAAYHHHHPFNNISMDMQLNNKLLLDKMQMQTQTAAAAAVVASQMQSQKALLENKQPFTTATIAAATTTATATTTTKTTDGALHEISTENSLNLGSERNNAATIQTQFNHASNSSISSLCSSTVVVNDEDWESGSRSSYSNHLKKHCDYHLAHEQDDVKVKNSNSKQIVKAVDDDGKAIEKSEQFLSTNAAAPANATTTKAVEKHASKLFNSKSKFSTISSINFFGKRNFPCTISTTAAEARTFSASAQKFKLKTRKNRKMLSQKFKWLKTSFRAGAEHLKENFVEQTATVQRNCAASSKRNNNNLLQQASVPVENSFLTLNQQNHHKHSANEHNDIGNKATATATAAAANFEMSTSSHYADAELDFCNDFYSSICDDQLSYNSPFKSPKALLEHLKLRELKQTEAESASASNNNTHNNTSVSVSATLDTNVKTMSQNDFNAKAASTQHDDDVVVVAANPAKNHCIGFNVSVEAKALATDGNSNLSLNKTDNVSDLLAPNKGATFDFAHLSNELKSLTTNANSMCKVNEMALNLNEQSREKSLNKSLTEATSELNRKAAPNS